MISILTLFLTDNYLEWDFRHIGLSPGTSLAPDWLDAVISQRKTKDKKKTLTFDRLPIAWEFPIQFLIHGRHVELRSVWEGNSSPSSLVAESILFVTQSPPINFKCLLSERWFQVPLAICLLLMTLEPDSKMRLKDSKRLTLFLAEGGGGFGSPLRFFVCHCQTNGDREQKLSDF